MKKKQKTIYDILLYFVCIRNRLYILTNMIYHNKCALETQNIRKTCVCWYACIYTYNERNAFIIQTRYAPKLYFLFIYLYYRKFKQAWFEKQKKDHNKNDRINILFVVPNVNDPLMLFFLNSYSSRKILETLVFFFLP